MKAITLRYINSEEKQTNFYLWIRDIFKETVITTIPQKNSGEYGHFFHQKQANKQQQQKPVCKIA